MANTKKIQLCSEKGQEKGMKKIELSSLEGCILDDNYTIVVIDGKKYVDIDKVTEFIFKEDEDKLPVYYTAYTPCFRTEAGRHGLETPGIFRLHQFDKVEMVSFVPEEDTDKEHDYLLSLEEKLFQMLEVPYRVVKMWVAGYGTFEV